MRVLSFVTLCFVLLLSCKKSSPAVPEKVTLINPEENSECTPIQSDGENSSIVEFVWEAADNTENYELQVTNLNTGTVQSKNTSNTVETLSLTKGTPFSWVVVSENSETSRTTTSDSWLFYNPGTDINHVPFPATLTYPVQGSTAFVDENGQIALTWVGNDVDGDIFSYDIYFSEDNPPIDLLRTTDAGTNELTINVDKDRVYFWKVVTTDEEGNISSSAVTEFKTR